MVWILAAFVSGGIIGYGVGAMLHINSGCDDCDEREQMTSYKDG
jgi:hypothetical protein